MMNSVRIVLRFKQKSRRWKRVTCLPSEIQMITSKKFNCRLIGKDGQNPSTADVMYPVT